MSVTIQNEREVSEILYGKNKSKSTCSKLNVDDYVRINKTKRTLDKGYLPNWTQELFKISSVVETQFPIIYKIEDLDGESVRATFYS